MKSQSITDDRGIATTFQGQNIKTGSFLYTFQHCAVVQVLSIVDCGGAVCVVYNFKRAEFTISLTDENFCTVPTLEEAEKEKEKVNFAINTGAPYQTIELYKGRAVKNPLIDNLLATDTKKSIVRYASIIDADAEGFTVSSRFVLVKFKNGTARTKTVVGLGSFLHVFFTDRVKELRKQNKEASVNIKTGKAVTFILEKMYDLEFIIEDRLRQHKDGLTFAEWLKSNELI